MSEVAEKAAEVTAEVVEEAVDGVVDVLEVGRTNTTSLVVVGILGLAVGGAAGYFIARKKLRAYYEDLASQEIAEARQFYSGIYKTDEDGTPLTPQEVLAQRHGAEEAARAAEAVRTYRGETPGPNGPFETEEELMAGEPYDDVVDERQIRKIENARIHSVSVDKEPSPHGGQIEVMEKTETRSVWDGPAFDYQEELKYRTEEKPYIITHDEYFAAEKDYETTSLTYYEVDDTLTDDRDQPIREIDKTIGEDHLIRFGTASNDKNIVYIRNDRLGTDYEVIKSTGSYLEEVLGMGNDEEHNSLRHSNRNAEQARRRAFRHGDG